MFDKLATKMDLQQLETRLKHDLTLRIGCILVAGFALMAGLLKLML